MRIIRLFAATMFIAAIAAIPAFAQQRGGAAQPAAPAPGGPVPTSKIAFVNTQAFGDEKVGIGRYVAAMKNLEREFAPRVTELQNLQNRIKAIVEEINKLNTAGGASGVVSQKSLDDKRDEGERLQRELEYKKKEYDAALAKRYEDVVGPISNDIGNALTNFAKSRGITVVFDLSKPAMLETILFGDPALDITSEFITEYNSKNPATASTAAPGR